MHGPEDLWINFNPHKVTSWNIVCLCGLIIFQRRTYTCTQACRSSGRGYSRTSHIRYPWNEDTLFSMVYNLSYIWMRIKLSPKCKHSSSLSCPEGVRIREVPLLHHMHDNRQDFKYGKQISSVCKIQIGYIKQVSVKWMLQLTIMQCSNQDDLDSSNWCMMIPHTSVQPKV